MLTVLNKQRWKTLHRSSHDKTTKFITVTNLIQFLGYGYESRYQMFKKAREKGGDRAPPSPYLELCLAYGNKHEGEAIDFLEKRIGKRYEFVRIPKKTKLCIISKRLIGTPDCFVVDKLTGEWGIVEIKCPFGGEYGRWMEEPKKTIRFEKEKKHMKHWIQLQLYLLMYGESASFGILAYYYPFVTELGGPLCHFTRVTKDVNIADTLSLEQELDSYFFDYCQREGPPKRERLRKDLEITEEYVLSIGLSQRETLREEGIYTTETL